MKKLALVFFAVLATLNLLAAYLENVPIELKQPDGTIINCFITGDEFHRRVHVKDNYTIIQNPETGYYVFALKEVEQLIPSEYVVGKSDPKQLGIEPNLDIPVKQMEEKRALALKSARISFNTQNIGKLYNQVVFIRFSNDYEFSDVLDTYVAKFNNPDHNKNSIYNYFKEVSYDQLEVITSFYPISENGNILSYQDINPRNYYNPRSVTNPVGYKDGIEYTERKYSLLSNALKA